MEYTEKKIAKIKMNDRELSIVFRLLEYQYRGNIDGIPDPCVIVLNSIDSMFDYANDDQVIEEINEDVESPPVSDNEISSIYNKFHDLIKKGYKILHLSQIDNY